MDQHLFFIVMGVSGSGKSTIGHLLANHLNCPFYDADDFHPAENVAKMASGQPLTDNDRAPWLENLHTLVSQHLADGETAVLACSALKKSYRDHLKGDLESVQFIYLNGRFDLIWQRMQARPDHFMKPDMLRSQFEALEPPSPQEALIIDIDKSAQEIIQDLLNQINETHINNSPIKPLTN